MTSLVLFVLERESQFALKIRCNSYAYLLDDENDVKVGTQMSIDLEAIQLVCEKLDSYIEIIDSNEDYDFIDELDDPNLTLMGMMIARGYLREEIEITSKTVPILLDSESALNPIIRDLVGSDDE